MLVYIALMTELKTKYNIKKCLIAYGSENVPHYMRAL